MNKALIAGLLALTACPAPGGAPPSKSPATATATAEGPGRLPSDRVVATLADGKVTYGELFAKRASAFRSMRNNYLRQQYDTERQTLDAIIVERVVKAAAAKAGKPDTQWFEEQIGNPTATEEEIVDFYDTKVRASGQKFEDIKAKISEHLSEQKKNEARTTLIKKMLAEAKAQVDLPAPEFQKVEFDLKDRPVKGAESAKITIVEFSDFECPYCSKAVGKMKEIMTAYPNDVKFYFLHFPLDFHKNALPSAIAARCAQKQGKFWEFHDKIFEKQRELSPDLIQKTVDELGLNIDAFTKCAGDEKTTDYVAADMAQGELAGVEGTPSVFIDGVPAPGIPSVEEIKKLLGG